MMYVGSEDGTECRWPGRVVCANGTEEFHSVEYEDENDCGGGVNAGVFDFEFPLLNDYAENELKILPDCGYYCGALGVYAGVLWRLMEMLIPGASIIV